MKHSRRLQRVVSWRNTGLSQKKKNKKQKVRRDLKIMTLISLRLSEDFITYMNIIMFNTRLYQRRTPFIRR